MEEARTVLRYYGIPTGDIELQVLSQGLINLTLAVLVGKERKYVLQKINQDVFPDTESLESNLERVLPLLEADGYAGLEFYRTREGGLFYRSPEGQVWRLMSYLPNSLAHHNSSDRRVAFEAGRVLGLFHRLVSGLSHEQLSVPLERFHDLTWRMEQYWQALSLASEEDLSRTQDLRKFVDKVIPQLETFQQIELPVRVCHNDSKLNNILFSKKGKALCMVDLDTLMPGHFAYDFGDAARTIANPAPEEETELSRIRFSLEMFSSFAEGLSLNGHIFSEADLLSLPLSVVYMPFMHGLRAYTDFLLGNPYYKVSYPDQNLDRARSLFHFSKLALERQAEIEAVISDHLRKRSAKSSL